MPDTPSLEVTNRFFEPAPGTIAADLVELGLNVPEADRPDAFTRKFMGKKPTQVTPRDQVTFASMLNQEPVAAAEQTEKPPGQLPL